MLDVKGCVRCLSVICESVGSFTMSSRQVGGVHNYGQQSSCRAMVTTNTFFIYHPCPFPHSQSAQSNTTVLANGAAGMFTCSQKAGFMIKHLWQWSGKEEWREKEGETGKGEEAIMSGKSWWMHLSNDQLLRQTQVNKRAGHISP